MLGKMSNKALVRLVKTGSFTPTEIELAERLGEAIREIELLTAQLRALPPTAAAPHPVRVA